MYGFLATKVSQPCKHRIWHRQAVTPATDPRGWPAPAAAYACTCPATGPGNTPGGDCLTLPADHPHRPDLDRRLPGPTGDDSGTAGQTGSRSTPRHRRQDRAITMQAPPRSTVNPG